MATWLCLLIAATVAVVSAEDAITCADNPCPPDHKCVHIPILCLRHKCKQYHCVPKEQTCDGANEHHSQCGGCDMTCEEVRTGRPRPCTAMCHVGCFCDKGYVRDENHKCVPEHQCKRDCPRNEHFEACGGCDETCEEVTTGRPRPCTRMCHSGCHCDKGYARNGNGRCIPRDSCRKEQCPKNEHFEQCGGCDETCEEVRTGRPRPCTRMCHIGCHCDKGYARNDQNTCVPRKQCTRQPSMAFSQTCGENEEYVTCGYCDKTCHEVISGQLLPCTRMCHRGCHCKKGFARHPATGTCVAESQCVMY